MNITYWLWKRKEIITERNYVDWLKIKIDKKIIKVKIDKKIIKLRFLLAKDV